jgi:hypothetical protein
MGWIQMLIIISRWKKLQKMIRLKFFKPFFFRTAKHANGLPYNSNQNNKITKKQIYNFEIREKILKLLYYDLKKSDEVRRSKQNL